jgi:sugar lactone lactonase YvrE
VFEGAVMKKLLSVAAAAVLAVAVMFFAFSYNDDGSGVAASSTQNQPASPRSYIVSTVAGRVPQDWGRLGSDGPGATVSFVVLTGIALGPDGSLYVVDRILNNIRKLATDGTVSTIAGNRDGGYHDGDCVSATFQYPEGIVVDKAGNVYVADGGNDVIRKVSMRATGCQVSTLAGSGTSGHADGTGEAASFTRPNALAVDAVGNLYVTEIGTTIRKVTPDGVVSTIAGNGRSGHTDSATSISALFRQPARLPAALYNRIFGDDKSLTATFERLKGIAVDAAGNVYVSEELNSDIRKITPDGWVSTLAGVGKYKADPMGVAVDAGGNVYVADSGNHWVRKISPAGEVATIAGAYYSERNGQPSVYRDGPADKAMFYRPYGVVVDGNGVIYVADEVMIRKITPEP